MIASRTQTLLSLGLLALCTGAWAADFDIRPDRTDGIYAPGEEVTWTIETVGLEAGETAPAAVKYTLKSNGLDTVKEASLPLNDGKASLTATREDAGTLLLTVEAPGIKALSGAAFDPRTLEPVLPRPADFDTFWAAKLKELDAIPLNPQLTPEDSPKPQVELWQLTLDNIRDTEVHGQLARPKDAKGKLPAMLIVQWAGVYPLNKDWACGYANDGWLVLNIIAHDLPIYEKADYYNELKDGALKAYPTIGNDDRETSYFLRMYLSCVQAVRYLTSREDWNGETLVVRGGSQGGLQTLVTAALCSDTVTAAIASIPAGCDANGPVGGRAPGWPRWYYATGDKDPEKVRQAAEYYDVVNFASEIRCPTLIGMGLADVTCPAPGVFTAANQIQGPVELVVMPSAGHKATKLNPRTEFYTAEKAWLAQLQKGEVPLKQ
ncbi:MAG: acetylxylan esterase [Verrucomicrobiota bacterium JB024]|nr:acetylxylan esterase [Verrucomicrobiota bacterium JB024]